MAKVEFDTLFSLKVLDPAMGSGHFLVHTVDFIADRIITFLAEYPENPVIRRVEEMRTQILEDVRDRQGVEIDKTKLTEVNLIKRMVMKRCIYGVDLNSMAVELAKLSLWLDSFTLGAPLSFLDHHLKFGNSLIGSTVEEVRKGMREEEFEGPQSLLFGSQFTGLLSATELMREVGELTDSTFDEVQRSTSLYKEADTALSPFKILLDFWVSEYFGAKGARNFLKVGGDVASLLRSPEKLSPQAKKLLSEINRLKAERRFFHWELEFPEVFYDQTGAKEHPGFDTVLGNPPYVRSELADKEERNFLMKSGQFQRLWGRFDLYLAFLEKGLELATQAGRFGMIVPDAILTINYGIEFRKWILQNHNLSSILDLNGLRVFEDAAVAPTVLIIQKGREALHPITSIHKLSQAKTTTTAVLTIPQGRFLNLPQSAIRIDLDTASEALKPKIDEISIPCGQLCYAITGFVGHDSDTGASKDRLIHPTAVNLHCKPYVEAKEWSGRYSFVESTRYFEYVPEKMHRPKFRELFERPKILIQRLASGGLIEATLDNNQIYVNHVLNCCVKLEDVIHLGESRLHVHSGEISPDERYKLSYILSLIASSLLGFYHRQFLSLALDIFPETIRQLPIRRINFGAPEKERAQLLEKGKKLYERCLLKGDQACVLEFVAHALKQTPEQADVVHDLLGFLAEQMIEMHKAKQTEVKGFLTWLEREIGAKVDDLKNKTKLKNYHDGAFEVLLEVLKENHRALNTNPSDRKFQDRLEKEYADSLAKLGPLKAHIEATDRLIDQIVYRLYSLTDEEIKIVEDGAT